MKHEKTTGIVLGRINFGEADRIISILTPEYGKLRLMARGVRKEKSKLAGGIELFSITQISFIPAKREIGTLVSSRLVTHFEQIVKDIERTMLGYELLTTIDKHTEQQCDEEYFQLLKKGLEALNDEHIPTSVIKSWFSMRLLTLGGHTPNLQTDTNGHSLTAGKRYQFDHSAMRFSIVGSGGLSANHIKYLRLLVDKAPKALQRISGSSQLASEVQPLLSSALSFYA